MFAVRPAEARDAKAAVDVVSRAILESCTDDHRGDADTIAKWLSNKTIQHFASWFADQENYCAIAEADGRILGVALLQRSGEIVLFYLLPSVQRQGIGSALHFALEQQASAWRLAKLKLDSTVRACPFYEKLGYRTAGPARARFGVLYSYPYEKSLPSMDDQEKRNLEIAERDVLNALNDVRRLRGLKPLEALPVPPFCSFCGEGKNEVRALVEGLDAIICDQCAAEAHRLMRKLPGSA